METHYTRLRTSRKGQQREPPRNLFFEFPDSTFLDYSQIAAAFDPSFIDHNGSFIEDSVVRNDKTPAAALTNEVGDRLWEFSEKLWGTKFEVPE